MKRRLFAAITMTLCLIVLCFNGQEVWAVESSGLRALSLRVLQLRLQEWQGGGDYPDELRHLAGLKKITGYIVDEENSDLILIGATEEASPRLYLEDFVVALRNAWLKYAQLKDNTYIVSDPSCTIDPDPGVMNMFGESGNQMIINAPPGDVMPLVDDRGQSSMDETGYNYLGLALQEQGRFDEAIAAYQNALKVNVRFDEAYFNLGNVFFRQGLIDQAIKQYHAALEVNPEHAYAYNNLGLALQKKSVAMYNQHVVFANNGLGNDAKKKFAEYMQLKDDAQVKLIEAKRLICGMPQSVRVFGIPFQTRFGRVMVEADYEMKLLVNGSEKLNIPGFLSLMELGLQDQKKMKKTGDQATSGASLDRFWFFPGKNVYEEDAGIAIIKQCQVTLRTEEEYINRKGRIAGKGRPDPLAQTFADNFTAAYDKIAQKKSIYADLANLFRFVALAKILRFKDKTTESVITYLLNTFSVPQEPLEAYLPGRFNYSTCGRSADQQSTQFSCGGVGIGIRVEKDNFIEDTGLEKVKSNVLEARPAADILFWDL